MKWATAVVVCAAALTGCRTHTGEHRHDGKAGHSHKHHEADAASVRGAAERGDAGAQNRLGTMYACGEGVPQDMKEAVRWYRRAAEQGDAAAQANMGIMYGEGEGVPQDFVLSYMWSSLSVESGNRRAARERDEVAKRMTKEQVAEAQRLAREWQPRPRM